MLDDYLMSLSDAVFTRSYDAFWVGTVILLIDLLGSDTEPDLETLKRKLLDYHAGLDVSPDEIEDIPHEILRLRGPGFWRGTSPLGLKYRCINALASSAEQNDDDRYNWRYGVTTALQ